MIPKVIHYCWFGGNPLPEEAKKCIKSWKKYCPEYKIIEWNESNYDYKKNEYTKTMYEQKKWAHLSDYVRLDVVYNNGGIYLDTDVEVLKPLDPLLSNKAFMGVETGNLINTGLGFGAVKKHPTIRLNMDLYNCIDLKEVLENIEIINCPYITTNLFKNNGWIYDNKVLNILDTTIYPIEYFCPMNYKTGDVNITKNTFSIHKYNRSWGNKLDNQLFKMKQLYSQHRLLILLKPVLNIFYFIPGSIIYKIKRIGFLNTLKFCINKFCIKRKK